MQSEVRDWYIFVPKSAHLLLIRAAEMKNCEWLYRQILKVNQQVC